MSYYRTCPVCGVHLDPGEKCDCQRYIFRELKTGCGGKVVLMEPKKGETPAIDVSHVCRAPGYGYVMHIARPEDRAECLYTVMADEIGNGCEVIETMGKYECILKIDHRKSGKTNSERTERK